MPTVPSPTLLDLAERAGQLACFDTESTGLNGDYNSLLVVSVKPYGKKPVTFTVRRPGDDEELVREATAYLRQFRVVVAYFGMYHDLPLLKTRLLFHGLPDYEPEYRVDPWWIARKRLKLSRRSQGHIIGWLGLPEEKLGVSAQMWNKVLYETDSVMPLMVKRCESDTKGLEQVYRRLRSAIPGQITRHIG